MNSAKCDGRVCEPAQEDEFLTHGGERGWQPALLVDVHPGVEERIYLAPVVDKEKRSTVFKRVVRVKEVPMLCFRRKNGCDAQRIFLVHDEDSGCINAHVCEHEVISD